MSSAPATGWGGIQGEPLDPWDTAGAAGSQRDPPSTQHPHCGVPRHLDLSPRGTQGQSWHQTAAKGPPPRAPTEQKHHGGVPQVTLQAGGGESPIPPWAPIPSQPLFCPGLFTLSPNDPWVQRKLKAFAPARPPHNTPCTPQEWGAAGAGTGAAPKGQKEPRGDRSRDRTSARPGGPGQGGRRDPHRSLPTTTRLTQARGAPPAPFTPPQLLGSKELYLKIHLCTHVVRGQ